MPSFVKFGDGEILPVNKVKLVIRLSTGSVMFKRRSVLKSF